MKKLSALIGALIIISALSACGGRKYSPEELLESEYTDALSPCGVDMEVRGSVSGDSLRVPVRFKNTSGSECSYDSMRRLEVRLGNKWYIVPDSSPAVALSSYTLPAGAGADSELLLEGHYGCLPRGQYRIIKEFTSSDSRPLTACAEFQVR